jgi:hypothetical protein
MNTTKQLAWLKAPAVATVGLLMIASGSMQAADNPVRVCEAAKIGAAGVRSACLAEEQADARQGRPSDPAKCETKFDEAIAKSDAKAAKHGVACRYLDNGDGTVSDLNTLLIWEKKTNDGSVHDVFNSYTWTVTDTAPDGPVFTDFLGKLNFNASGDGATVTGGFAGHIDWRLPTTAELLTIVIEPFPCASFSPCIDPIFGPTLTTQYWSSTSFAINPIFAWSVDFGLGAAGMGSKFNIARVRAVRGGR